MRKGEQTRSAILDDAAAFASQVGLEGLSIGSLAGRLGMSKSGLFAHFGSKEELQLATLKRVQEQFEATVFRPAMAAPRGLPRLEALFANWTGWAQQGPQPGGCVLLGAAAEYDDRPGPVRDLLASGQRELRGAIAKTVRLAVEEGHFRTDVDPWQFAFELLGIVLAAHHDRRLLDDGRTMERAARAFDQLIRRHRA